MWQASAGSEGLMGLHCTCRDCWTVAFGNSYNDEERCVLAGYDNGDVKMFDLRMNKVGGGSGVIYGMIWRGGMEGWAFRDCCT